MYRFMVEHPDGDFEDRIRPGIAHFTGQSAGANGRARVPGVLEYPPDLLA